MSSKKKVVVLEVIAICSIMSGALYALLTIAGSNTTGDTFTRDMILAFSISLGLSDIGIIFLALFRSAEQKLKVQEIITNNCSDPEPVTSRKRPVNKKAANRWSCAETAFNVLWVLSLWFFVFWLIFGFFIENDGSKFGGILFLSFLISLGLLSINLIISDHAVYLKTALKAQEERETREGDTEVGSPIPFPEKRRL